MRKVAATVPRSLMAKSYTTGSMANGTARSRRRLVSLMMRLHAVLRFGFAARIEEKSHAAAGHAAQHPEAPEIVAHFGARARSISVSV